MDRAAGRQWPKGTRPAFCLNPSARQSAYARRFGSPASPPAAADWVPPAAAETRPEPWDEMKKEARFITAAIFRRNWRLLKNFVLILSFHFRRGNITDT